MPAISKVPFSEGEYGFQWGSLGVTRVCSNEKNGWVILMLESPKCDVEVYCTKTGKIRIFMDGKELMQPRKAAKRTPRNGGSDDLA